MENKQHVQLPNNMIEKSENLLSPKDLLVYVAIKSFMNKDSLECFPSLETIVEVSGVSKPTVRKAIDNLKATGYITVRKQGRSNIYKFNPYKNFEPFSYEFLKDKTLDANIKAFLVATQQSMYKDEKGIGKLTYTDKELGDIINLDKRTVAKYHKTLKEQGLLTTLTTNIRDPETGLFKEEKIYHLDKLGQAVIWTLQNHEERIDSTEKTTQLLLKRIEELEAREKERDAVINKIIL